MSVELKDSDSTDSDIFVLKEVKPINKSSRQQIRQNSTLSTSNSKVKKKRSKIRKASTDSDEIKFKKIYRSSSSHGNQLNFSNDIGIKNKSLNIGRHAFSKDGDNNLGDAEVQKNKNDNYFTVANNHETAIINSPIKSVSDPIPAETIQYSPGIKRNKKRYLLTDSNPKLGTPKKSAQKSLLKEFDIEEGPQTAMKELSKLYVFLLKKMITEETDKQSHLEETSFRNGIVVENLISENEGAILRQFFNLTESSSAIFVKMLGRKKSWHRVSDIKYEYISHNLKCEFENLHKKYYVDLNIEDEDLKTQLDLLKKSEISNLCKKFKVSLKFSASSKKEALINSLIQEVQKQKGVVEMFKKNNSVTRAELLRAEVKKCLGMCIKLSSKTFDVFYKILVLSSFPHYYGQEQKRFSDVLFQSCQVYKNEIKYPDYKVSSTVVFETQSDLQEYIKALSLQDSFEIAITNKNYEEFTSIYFKAKEKFQELLINNEYKQRILKMKPFLRKFSAGTIYARILNKYCSTFKKKTEISEILDTVKLLLNQNLFLVKKKGEWYDILAKALESQKQNNEAAEVIIKSLNDPIINEVQKLTLQLHGRSLLKKQSGRVDDADLRDMLEGLCELSVKEPNHIEIKGKALDGNKTGYKSVYVEELGCGKNYTTVEERAISHYKSVGFDKGYHSEGLIVQSIYFLLFFDVIYGFSPEGVFQSPYQEAPLDFHSSSFYLNRKEPIDILLSDMISWDDLEVEAKIKNAYDKNYKTICLIKWTDGFTPELFCELIKCITMPILVLIFQRFVKNFREVRAGFPDLTLWNPKTNQCKFVEVKSPSDKLSPAQRLWLDFLRNIGLDCEVCNVKNMSGKNLG